MRQKDYQQVSRERLPAGVRTKKVRFGAIAGR
jgi:hypothetical protein